MHDDQKKNTNEPMLESQLIVNRNYPDAWLRKMSRNYPDAWMFCMIAAIIPELDFHA
jgi:hypothetical protein